MRHLVYILSLVLFVACSNGRAPKNVLAVTAEPYRFVVEAVAGDSWQVITIVPKDANPETFDPSPANMVALSDCAAYFMVGGLGFEDAWKEKIADVYPRMRLVDTSSGIDSHIDDPHLWTSPDNMALIANNVCKALCSLDSANGEGYRERLRLFVQRVEETDSAVACKLAPCSGKSFLIVHPALTYFADRYSLNQIAIEQEGKEPSAAHIRSIIDSARQCGVKTVLIQGGVSVRSAFAIAGEIGANVKGIDHLAYDWHKEMLHIATVLSED